MILENFKIALTSIKANKMRTLLTALGIVIGIMSVVIIVSLSNGLKNTINSEFSSLGAGRTTIQISGHALYESGASKDSVYITKEDIEIIRNKVGHKMTFLQPYLQSVGKTYSSTNKNKMFKLDIIGVVPEYKDGVNVDIIKGRFINDLDNEAARNVCIIKNTLAEDLFGTTDCVGKTMSVNIGDNTQNFVVIGVYKQDGALLNMTAGSSTDFYIPFNSFTKNISNPDTYTVIDGAIKLGEDSNKVASTMQEILLRRHPSAEKNVYMKITMDSQLGMVNNVLNVVTLVLGIIAAISLLVGGIGVMNIMLVSVTERTREIGIRKALGAKYSEIMLQFLIESMIVSLIGGILGVMLGILIAIAVAAFVPVIKNPYPDFMSIIVAFIFSSLVGILFGILPARKAAKLNPIDALRYE